jgi:hypothetical protein
MRKAAIGLLALAMAAAALSVSMAGASHGEPGFKTAKPPYLLPAAPGVVIDPILSTGDVVPGRGTQPPTGGPPQPYQMSGIPDGIGAYRSGDDDDDDDDDDDGGYRRYGRGSHKDSVVVVMNHELGTDFPSRPAGVDTRISRLEIDPRTRSVHAGEYLFTGHEGLERFCSSFLTMIHGKPMYFTGEEATHFAGSAGPPPSPPQVSSRDGTSIALDPETGMWNLAPQWGKLNHENVVPMKLSKWVILTTDDDFRPGPSYLYAYIANDINKAIRGVEGDLYVFKADNSAKNQNSTVLKGESIPGRFVPVTQAENSTSATLKAAATAKEAFRFDRLEDIAVRPGIRGRTYIVDTGKPPQTLRGRVYQFDINPRDPTRAVLRMVLNGDPPNNDDIVNGDNMDASEKVLVIQEDRESAFRGDASRVLVWNYDLNSQPRTVARVARPETAARFSWESSGIFKAGHLLGKDWWLLDVQAHDQSAPQPGPTLTPNSGEGEDGQLLAIKIPGSQSNDDERERGHWWYGDDHHGHDDDDDDDD